MSKLDGKKILIAAGGTGGHINPALAVAGYIRDNCEGAQIVFVGTKKKMEATLVPQAGFELRNITISGFRRSFTPAAIIHNIRTVIYLLRSTGQAKKIIKDFKPDLVVGFGGYVSGRANGAEHASFAYAIGGGLLCAVSVIIQFAA